MRLRRRRDVDDPAPDPDRWLLVVFIIWLGAILSVWAWYALAPGSWPFTRN